MLSKKKTEELYRAIHTSITDLRIELNQQIDSQVDFKIAQVEHKIWDKMKLILGIK